ncbi:MAG: hypothetical protein D6709_11675 [Chloroflexi bacterium]|uniref:Uncharacterized protein n=1 Tax=Candidatus Thermofonsia Clade 3 bacterium TaxID=2364212 RepID=A0A2M8QFJ7_9CHLR|nr:MAG: hypothetical protein CUN48_02575 [Candidatus Thermofonsia Clade 3 bacterium]RMG62399.1 MAG: hypothetical protein D6709_11675 [Chloroflexota bacterium]
MRFVARLTGGFGKQRIQTIWDKGQRRSRADAMLCMRYSSAKPGAQGRAAPYSRQRCVDKRSVGAFRMR